MWRQGTQLYSESSRPTRRQASASKEPSNLGLDARFFNRSETEGGGEVKLKAVNLAKLSYNGKPQSGDVAISSFMPSTGGQGFEQRRFISQAEGQGSLRQAIVCDFIFLFFFHLFLLVGG